MQDSLWDFSDPHEWMARSHKLPPMAITCALNGGIQGKESHPALPELPHEIAAQAREACEAGASIVHIHGRDRGNYTNCTDDPEVYREILGLVREQCPDAVLNMTTGGGPTTTMEGRLAVLESRPEMASLNLGPEMGRYALPARQSPLLHPREATTVDMLIPATFGFIDRLAESMLEKGIKPECEVYQPGHVGVSRSLIKSGLLKPPYAHQLVMGVQAFSNATPWNLIDLLRELPAGSLFTVAATGKFQLPMVTMAIILGGNVRVGLEDNLYLRRGLKLKGNGEAVEKVVRLAEELGRTIATPAQTRAMLGLSATPSSY